MRSTLRAWAQEWWRSGQMERRQSLSRYGGSSDTEATRRLQTKPRRLRQNICCLVFVICFHIVCYCWALLKTSLLTDAVSHSFIKLIKIVRELIEGVTQGLASNHTATLVATISLVARCQLAIHFVTTLAVNLMSKYNTEGIVPVWHGYGCSM